MFSKSVKFFRKVRIPDFVSVEINDTNTHAVFHFPCAKIMQKRLPMLVFFQIFGDMFGKKNVPRIAAIHHSLCHVDSASGDIRSLIHIGNAADRTAVHAHPKLYPWVFLESATNFDRALRGRFRTGVKYQRHPVTGRDFKQTVRGFGSLKLLGRANKLV